MRKRDAIEYFGTQAALARALGIRSQSINDWGEIVPPLRQLQIHKRTRGKLKAAPDVLDQLSPGGRAA